MPETRIGFFTDVGGSYFLSRLHGSCSLGLYLGLVGHRLTGKDLVKWGVATHYVPNDKLDELYDDILYSVNEEMLNKDVRQVVERHSDNSVKEERVENEDVIKHCFQDDSLKNCMLRLYDLSLKDNKFAKNTWDKLNTYSPLSLNVVFEQIKRGRHMNLKNVYSMEYKLSQGFMNNDDFFEGVRALLIDKDNKPRW